MGDVVSMLQSKPSNGYLQLQIPGIIKEFTHVFILFNQSI